MANDRQESKRIKVKIVESDTDLDFDKVRECVGNFILDALNYNLDVIWEYIDEDVEKCKQKIESWYKEGDHNMCLVQGLDDKAGIEHLANLRDLKPFRDKKYLWFEKRNPEALKHFVNLICNNPDIVYKGQYTGKRYDTKIITRRDLRDRTDRRVVKLRKDAEAKIKKYVEQQNRKLRTQHFSFGINPIMIDFCHDPTEAYLYSHRVKEIITLFLEDLSSIIKPYLKSQTERAAFIAEILK